MQIGQIGLVTLPKAEELQVANRLYPDPNTMEDGGIIIKEMMINNDVSPDIALIETK